MTHHTPGGRDLTGFQADDWTVTRFVRKTAGVSHWEIRCVCGTLRVRTTYGILSRASAGCGCRKVERISAAKRRPRVRVAEKVCATCRVSKPADCFTPRSTSVDGLQGQCKVCRNAAIKLLRAQNKVRSDQEREACRRWRAKRSVKSAVLYKKYRITIEEYESLKAGCGFACEICSRPESAGSPLCVDHDHATGAIRGILCRHCNTGLGLLGDGIDGVARAARYLNRSRAAATPSPTTAGRTPARR